MIVIVSYKQKELLDNANIDAIKELYGQFTVDDLINNFKNYFFTKMIVDATSVVDFTKRDVLTKLSNEFGADKLILLLPEKPDPPQKFIDMLKDIGIKNYCTKVDELNKFLNDNTMPSNEFDNKINQIENNDSSDNKEPKGLEDFNSDINTMNNDITNDFDSNDDDYGDDQSDNQFDDQDDNFNDFVNYQSNDNNQNNNESQNMMDNSSYFQDATSDNNMNNDFNINEKHDDMNFSNNINNPFDVNAMNQNNDNSYNNSNMNNNDYMDNRFNDTNNDIYSNQNMSNDYNNQSMNNNFNNFSNNDYNNQGMNNNFNNFNMNNNGYNNQNMNNNYNNQDMGNIYDNNSNSMSYEDNNQSDIYNDSGSSDNSLMFFQNVDDNNNTGSSTPNNFVLGIKAVTEQAGTTSLIYMLKKEMEKNNINVAAYEYLTNDFRYFRSNNMFSINNENELKDKLNNDNFSVKILDLNNNEYDSLCTDILYLVEPSIIKMNKLTSSNPSLFGSLVDKKVVLNKCLLSEKEIGIFEREAQMQFFATIPPLNDRGSMNSLDEIIRKLNLK